MTIAKEFAAMRQIASHEEELALLVDSVEDYAISLISQTGEIRTWNRGAQRVFGYSAVEAIGTHFSRFYPEESAGKPANELKIAEAEGRVEDEGWRIRKDGTRFWANTVITPLRHKDGSLRGFSKVTRDLTVRKAAEEQTRRSEELFRLLVESVKDYAIFMLDPGGHIISWNPGAERLKQYRASEIFGKHFSIFYPKQDVESGKPQRELEIAKEQGSVEDEGWRVRKDGSLFWALVVITAVYDASGELRGFAKVTRDMTQRKEAEEIRRALLEQREARVQAEEEKRMTETSFRASQEANRSKDEFLMTLSHELRTPMTAIVGWARLLPMLGPDDPTFGEAIAAIGRSAKLQAELIDDVLDVSRIVSGKLRLSLDNTELLPVLLSSLDGVRPSAEAKRISLETSLDPNLGAAMVDSTRLHQIIWNLLSNAIKFTPKGGRVQLLARRSASQIQITVADTGEGIEPEFLPHVFEPFRQAEVTSTRSHGGLGLGLSIVRYLAEAHGGTVGAESGGRGKGSRFTITLPVRAVSRRNGSANKEEANPLMASLAGRNILVVDDDAEGRQLITIALRQAGAKVTAVDSGDAALLHVDQERPDIVLTDIAMPEMDGYALQRRLRERDALKNTRIVALTAFPASAVLGKEEEFDSYLRKPIDPFELAEKLRSLL